jgi:predicted permease
LSIGAATVAFGAYNTVRLKPLPRVVDQGRLFSLQQYLVKEPDLELGFCFPDYREVRDTASTLEGVFVHQARTFILTDRDQPERVLGGSISARTFHLLGVRPALGRDFLPAEEGPGSARVVLLGHGLWSRRYGADTNIVGSTIQISGEPATVVCVMPAGWRYPEESDIWAPIAATEQEEPRGNFYLEAVARLKPGTTREQATAELAAIARRLGEAYPETNAPLGLRLRPLREHMTRDVGLQLALLLGAVLFVQLIACANVASLLLVRGVRRARELAVRFSLGATRAQVFRLLLTEAVLIAVLGGALGFVLAQWGRDLCEASLGREQPFWLSFDHDWRVFLFATVLSLASVAAFGVLPAMQAAKPGLVDLLKEGAQSTGSSGGHLRVRHALVVAEVALALVLLVGAGLMLRSLIKTQNANPGYEASGLLTFRVGLPPAYYTNKTDYIRFFAGVTRELRGVPGVVSAGAVSALPAMQDWNVNAFHIEGLPEPALHEAPRCHGRTVSPGCLESFLIPLVAGRMFSEADTTNTLPVVLIDEAFAQAHFPGMDPLGKRIRAVNPQKPDQEPWLSVVGVVKTIRLRFDNRPQLPVAYRPHAQAPEAFMSVVVRTEGNPLAFAGASQQAVFRVNREIPVYHVRSMRQVIDRFTWDKRFFGGLFASFAGIALFLAALGIYGVMAFSVGQRTREIGLRVALGAQAPDVLRLILRQGLRLVLAGLALGIAVAFLLARLLEGVIYGISPYDPPVFGAVPVILCVVALVACWWPARRALRVDPMVALRCE